MNKQYSYIKNFNQPTAFLFHKAKLIGYRFISKKNNIKDNMIMIIDNDISYNYNDQNMIIMINI